MENQRDNETMQQDKQNQRQPGETQDYAEYENFVQDDDLIEERKATPSLYDPEEGLMPDEGMSGNWMVPDDEEAA